MDTTALCEDPHEDWIGDIPRHRATRHYIDRCPTCYVAASEFVCDVVMDETVPLIEEDSLVECRKCGVETRISLWKIRFYPLHPAPEPRLNGLYTIAA